jgi:hypothetical protein
MRVRLTVSGVSAEIARPLGGIRLRGGRGWIELPNVVHSMGLG